MEIAKTIQQSKRAANFKGAVSGKKFSPKDLAQKIKRALK